MSNAAPLVAAKKQASGPTKKELKARAKLEKAVAKGIDNAVREIARAAVKEVSRRPPPEFQSWGVIKSRACLKLASQCQRAANRQRPKTEDLTYLTWRLGMINDMPIDQCMLVLNPPKKEQPHA